MHRVGRRTVFGALPAPDSSTARVATVPECFCSPMPRIATTTKASFGNAATLAILMVPIVT